MALADGGGAFGGGDAPCDVGGAPAPLFVALLAMTVAAHAVYAGPLQAWFVLSVRAVNARYTALGLAYNTGAALLGGTAPLVATALVASPLGVFGAGAYLSLGALVSALTVLLSERCAPLEGHGAEQGLVQLVRSARSDEPVSSSQVV